MATKSKQMRLKDVKQGVTFYQLSFVHNQEHIETNNPYVNVGDITKVIRKHFVTGKPSITKIARNEKMVYEYGVTTDKGYVTLAFGTMKNNKLVLEYRNGVKFTTINAAKKQLKYYNPLGA